MAMKPYRGGIQSPELDAMMKQLNPNQLAPGNAAGLGSGNLLGQQPQKFNDPMFDMGTAPSFTFPDMSKGFNTQGFDPEDGDQDGYDGEPGDDPDGEGGEDDESGTQTAGQDPLDILKDYFPDADLAELEKLTKFVTVIPTEVYDAADPSAEMYSLMRQERTSQLEGARDLSEDNLRGSLFRSLEQARGMQGKRGFALGRNIYGDVSEAAATRFEGVQGEFGRGLYNINEEIINRITGAQKYLAGLEGQQKSDLLKLADLAGLLDPDDDDDEYEGSTDQNDADEQG